MQADKEELWFKENLRRLTWKEEEDINPTGGKSGYFFSHTF